ncbi:MAG: sensor histidine kinase [Burkholderiales bacterium]
MVESLVHDLHPLAGTDSTRLINAIPEDFVVYADAGLLRRVFQNLIANASSYTPRGEVVIGASVTVDGGTAECFVRDNGEGIPEDRRHSVFDKHETDPEKQEGLGLGLAIVKTFVEAHDEPVTVVSELGAGSTFRFTLPGQRS